MHKLPVFGVYHVAKLNNCLEIGSNRLVLIKVVADFVTDAIESESILFALILGFFKFTGAFGKFTLKIAVSMTKRIQSLNISLDIFLLFLDLRQLLCVEPVDINLDFEVSVDLVKHEVLHVVLHVEGLLLAIADDARKTFVGLRQDHNPAIQQVAFNLVEISLGGVGGELKLKSFDLTDQV